MKGFRWWGATLLLVLLFLYSAAPVSAQFRTHRQTRPPVGLPVDLAALRGQEPLVHEPFDEDLERWTTGNTARTSVALRDGMLRIRLRSGGVSAAAFAGLDLDDFLLEATAAHRSGTPDYTAAILFRVQGEAAFYAFQVRGNGETAVSLVLDGPPDYLARPAFSEAVHTGEGASNRLGILAEGARLTFLVNDVAVHTLDDEALTHGVMGLGASVFGQEGAEMTFDDLRVWELGRSMPGAPALTAPPSPTAVPAATAASTAVAATPTPMPTPMPTATPTPSPTPTRPLMLEDLPFDWSGLETAFVISNIRLIERKQPSSEATYAAVTFDVKAKTDLGIFVYMANFYEENGDVLVNADVKFTLDAASYGLLDAIGGWNTGAYGKAELLLPGSLSRVERIGFVRAF
jgi:hypothetical protein